MRIITIDGKEYEVAAEVDQYITTIETEYADLRERKENFDGITIGGLLVALRALKETVVPVHVEDEEYTDKWFDFLEGALVRLQNIQESQ